jgi:hypothetical protein
VRSIVIAPAKTGRERSNKKEVINSAHTYSGKRYNAIPGNRILTTVVIKFIAPKIEAAPDKCKLKIAKSTDDPG